MTTTPVFTASVPMEAPATAAPAPHNTALPPVPPLADATATTSPDPDDVSAYELLPIAARVALLTAAKAGLDTLLAKEKEKLIDLNADAQDNVSDKSIFGTVNYAPAKAKHTVDDEALLEYAKNDPDLAGHIETVEVVPDWVRSVLIERAIPQGDGVYALKDGTIVEYMHPAAPSSPQVAYPASKQQKVTKAAAEQVLAGMLGQLTTLVADATRQAS